MNDKRVFVGALKGPHGLKGGVKAKIGLDDFDMLVEAGPLLTEDGRALKVKTWQAAGQGLVSLVIEGVATVEAAEALRGVAVYLERENFPEIEGEVYVDELVGEEVLGPDGAVMGVVKGIVELPAGPAAEVEFEGKIKLLPLVAEFIGIGDELRLTEMGLAVLRL